MVPRNFLRIFHYIKKFAIESFIFLGYLQAICLPTDHLLVHDFVTEQTKVAGWGFYDPDLRIGSQVLLFVDLPIRDRCACNDFYLRQLDTSQLCVGLTTGKDSCNGDSGGPLMKEIMWKGKSRTFALGKKTPETKYSLTHPMVSFYTLKYIF